MNTQQDTYLWDPSAEPEPEIVKLEKLLHPQSAEALGLAKRELPLARATRRPRHFDWRRRSWHFAVFAAAASFAGIAAIISYRLSWTENSPWPVVVTREDTAIHTTLLKVGDEVTTQNNQTATVSAARIGKIELAANSSVALNQTLSNKHRLELKYGRLHARIWAPPGYFGVLNRGDVAVDLGCEFALQSNASGSGSLAVASGWVIYRRNGTEVLVPEGHSISFDPVRVGTPVRDAAPRELTELVMRLDNLLATSSGGDAAVLALAERIAVAASDEDRISLLSLLTRHRELRTSAIYARLLRTFGEPADGESLNDWWAQLPKQPKRWWVNWRDAF